MNFYPKAVFLLSIFITSFSSAKNLPNGIQSIVGGQAFFDGGSVILEFTDTDKIQWQAFLNKSLGEKKKKRIDSITLTKLSNGFGEKVIHQEGKLLKKGSKEETQFLSFLVEAIENERVKDEFSLQIANEFLEKKRRSNQASHTMSANARLIHNDPMEINLYRLGISTEAAIVWIWRYVKKMNDQVGKQKFEYECNWKKPTEDFDDLLEQLSDLINDPLPRRSTLPNFDTGNPKDSDLNKNKEIRI